MSDVNHAEREAKLQEREMELRLRELELEINRPEPPLQQTVKHRNQDNSIRSFKRDIVTAAKFSGFFLTGVVVIYISQWLAWISFFALLGTAGWAWYQYGRKN
jgi:hypothetical protein